MKGTVLQPLFCAADVATHIGDQNIRRATKDYDEKYRLWAQMEDAVGHKQRAAFLTEKGMYRYLLQSHRKEAAAFQETVYDLLAAERRRVVDAAQLEAKIARDAAAALGREAAALGREVAALERESKKLRGDLHRATEPREPREEEGAEEYISFCYAYLFWSRPDLAKRHNLFLARSTLPLPWDLREDLLDWAETGRRERAFVRFMQYFAENFPVRGAAAEREGPARAPTGPPCPP
ncbi:MAG TPA: Bro-N domain-containing protein [Elusimicrobiota bacterium]|nr:Bro-N domain-containing protein [Elusimicrobiota bacterium]